MSFQLTPIDMAVPASSSEAVARIAVALSLLAWVGVVAVLFWR